MSYLSLQGVKISGIAACVPKAVEETTSFSLFSAVDAQNFIKTTGVERHRRANDSICTSDLCLRAAERLIGDLKWEKESIDCLIFVSQTPDYILPATSVILQDRLGLSTNCYTLDISLGCSGWVYALSVISSLMSNGHMKRGLLLAGDTILKMASDKDKSSYPLFGDAGSATALEYTALEKSNMSFVFNTDGAGYRTIMIKDGGYRNLPDANSFVRHTVSEGIERSDLHLILEGMDVFSFGISQAPKSIGELVEHFSIDIASVDNFYFHQANLFMNEKIRKKLKIGEEKVPYSLRDFGNTSCASIPLTMVIQKDKPLANKKQANIACGFGVGLSWASVYFETDKIVVSELQEI